MDEIKDDEERAEQQAQWLNKRQQQVDAMRAQISQGICDIQREMIGWDARREMSRQRTQVPIFPLALLTFRIHTYKYSTYTLLDFILTFLVHLFIIGLIIFIQHLYCTFL